MAILTVQVLNGEEQVLFTDSAEDFVDLVSEREYTEGDQLIIRSSEYPIYLHIQVDEVLGESFVYLTGDLRYTVPFGQKKLNRSPKAFAGNRHYLFAKAASKEEIGLYRNLALNPNDQHADVPCYPHASANTETRGESVFAAQNAIDGIYANRFHGEWPYTSWGINRQSDAKIMVDFGRPVLIDKLVMVTRADFPHDSWWEQATVHFSDGSRLDWSLQKTNRAQEICFTPKTVTWVRLDSLVKADDPSPFPALSQLAVYGTDKILKRGE